MATANPPDTPSADESVFDAMREQITEESELIMSEVKSRRDQLLSEVEEKRGEFVLKKSATNDDLIDLEQMKSQMENMSIKQNVAMKKQQKSLADIKSEIVKLKTDMYKSTQLKYSCSLVQLIQQIKNFGEIIDETSIEGIYSNKLSAVQVIDGFEGQKFGSEMRLHVDSYKELLYVTYSSGEYVLIFNANNFTFIAKFGNNKKYPLCVATSKEFIYVGYSSMKLLQFKQTDYSVVKSISIKYFNKKDIRSIAVSSGNQVFMLDSTGRLFIYDGSLNFQEEIVLNLEKFGKVGDSSLGMILIGDIFYLYFNQSILFVTLGHWNNINFLFSTETGKIPNVQDSSVFCIDSEDNVIVADSATDSIKFVSPEGDLIHTIGEDTVGSDSIRNCYDITTYRDSIIVACRDDEYGDNIKIY